jgi:hypothetical protein
MVSFAIVTAGAGDFVVGKSKALPQRSVRGAEDAEKLHEKNARFRVWKIKSFTAKITKDAQRMLRKPGALS